MSQLFHINHQQTRTDDNINIGVPLKISAPDIVYERSVEPSDGLYNLTKLAEVSLAAAAGELSQYRFDDYQSDQANSYSHKIFDRYGRSKNKHFNGGSKQYRHSATTGTPIEWQECRTNGKNIYHSENGGLLDSDDGSPLIIDESVGPTETPSNALASKINLDTCEDYAVLRRQIHKEYVFECHDCNKRYSTPSNLTRHRQIHRSPADTKARNCPECGKLYVSMPAFAMHVRTHALCCRCPHCGKGFSRPWLLQGHIRTHTGEKPFMCLVCSKAFADKSNLRAHSQTHTNKKPYICRKCGKAFALKSYLYKHEEASCTRLHAKKSGLAVSTSVTQRHSVIVAPQRFGIRGTKNIFKPAPQASFQSAMVVEPPIALLPINTLPFYPQEEPVDFSTKGNHCNQYPEA